MIEHIYHVDANGHETCDQSPRECPVSWKQYMSQVSIAPTPRWAVGGMIVIIVGWFVSLGLMWVSAGPDYSMTTASWWYAGLSMLLIMSMCVWGLAVDHVRSRPVREWVEKAP